MTDERAERTADRVARIYANEPQIRNATPDDDLSAAIRKPGTSLSELVATVMGGYADRPALGRRATDLVVGADSRSSVRVLPEFETITYGETWEMVQAVAAAWHDDPEYPVRAGTFVSMVGFTGIDYTVVDLACIHLGAVAVPMQASASAQQLKSILLETEPVVLAVSADYLHLAVDLLLGGCSPPRVVIFDFRQDDDDHRDALEQAQTRLDDAKVPVALETLQSVIERGRDLPAAPHHRAPNSDSVSLLVYTSGSTGTPKGAIYTERMVKAMWLAHPLVAAINVNFTPLSHILGRISLAGVLSRGGTAYFTAKSDLSTLFDDIATVRPTELVFVPRVCDMVFERFLGEVERRTTTGSDPDVVEAEVKDHLRQHFFGGRAMTAICGSAPLAPEMKAFIESVLGLRLHDGYGSTEVGNGAVIDNRVRRPPVIDYKLVDVPELGYFSTDKPYPRGELLLKTTTMFPGYYKRPDLSREVFDHDGFYRTGDIVAETGHDQLVYVDRRNNVLKLSQGEFVTVAKVEAVFASSPLISQIYVYGNSERAFLLAVIVPSDQWGGSKAEISASLQQIAREAELNPYEIPRDFLIETEPFTTAGGLLSGIGKLLRPKLKERYGDRLEDLYAELARSQRDELLALRRTAADSPVLESVNRAAVAVLGCSSSDLKPDSHFIDLGGDSLSALSFSILLNEIFGVEIPVGAVTSPTNDLGALARLIERERSSGGTRPTFATVHQDPRRITASDLALEKFIDTATLSSTPTPVADVIRTVLITGANGYLGRFLCLEWLERLAPLGGSVICIVRGSDEAAARKRLTAAFDTGDAELARRFHELSAGHLEVVPGDIGEPSLGLDESAWVRLSGQVDLIVHSAALVNHVLPYRQLFGPNVVGTAELIRLALTQRIKPINFLSTVAVAAQAPTIDEDSDVRLVSPERHVDDSYANGYGNSKWASEVLLRDAHERYGLPVAVFRSDMILAHTRFTGQVNVPDMFTRLMLSLLLTGVAPKSFYETDAHGRRRRAHYEGLPVDFTAEAITGIGAIATSGFQTFDVVNPHDDDISLDRFVDWLIEAGHSIHRIDDYREWFTRFENGLRSLPESQRQHSVLPLLHAYRRPHRAIRGSMLPAQRFTAAVRDAQVGPDGEIPTLSPELIAKYVTDLQALELLKS